MITPELAWRKSSYSGNGGSCVEIAWRKSRHSGNGGDCVEIAWLAVDGMAVRDSKNTGGPTLEFSTTTWRAFLAHSSSVSR